MEQPHHNPRQAAPAGGGGGGSGLLAALTLLFVAFTNQSFEGLLFLLAFLAWGSYCLPAAARAAATAAPEQEQQAAGSAKSLWAAVSGLSALALLLQLATQLAFLLGAPGLTAPAVAATLRLLGFPRSDSAADALLVSWAFFGAIFVAAAHLVEGQFVQDMPSAPDQAWHRVTPPAHPPTELAPAAAHVCTAWLGGCGGGCSPADGGSGAAISAGSAVPSGSRGGSVALVWEPQR